MLDGRHQDVLGIYQILVIIRQHSNFFKRGYIFRMFKWPSSGFLTDCVNRCCVHVGIPICLHW